ncbi:MAG: DNA polymerase I [Oscillospiraceae bacterium]|jgi:DNA polymerase-1|nr:DNA polymerase I [Oscillospiraceae bacterium]
MHLLVLDGNSIFNRAFYGVKLLSTKDGRYTNALVGFLNIYLRLREECAPDAVAVAFDVKAPTFRHQLYAGYKAQRKGMPPELAEQLPVLKELLTAMGLRLLEAPGWEADDILGTLAGVARGEDRCTLATGDRDALQLISDRVSVLLASTRADRPETTRCTPDWVREAYGVEPAQLIEIKALMGDASDNIPGVAGVGQKTAQALIQQFGSVQGVYDVLDDPAAAFKPALRGKLAQGRDDAFLSRTLGTIRTDAPVPLDPAYYVPAPPDAAKVAALLAELEMFKLLERLRLQAAPRPAAEPAAAAVPSREETDPEALLARLRTRGKADFLPVLDGTVLEELRFCEPEQVTRFGCGDLAFPGFCRALLGDETIAKRTTDAKAIHQYAIRNEFPIRGLDLDTSLAGYLLNPNAPAYDPLRLAQEYGVSLPSGPDAAAVILPPLCDALEGLLREGGQWELLQDVELPLARVLASMELWGVAVDAEGLAAFGEILKARIGEISADIFSLAGGEFNLNSPKQLADVLFGKLGLHPPKKTKSGFSTAAEVLESLSEDHPVVALVLEYRALAKLKSTYCDGLGKVIGPDGRVRSTLNQTETRTGRISSSEPNLQNIPVRSPLGRELRRFFRARSGWLLVDADYSQIELRVLAHMAGEERMCAAFRAGTDIHAATAAEVFDVPADFVTPLLRTRAKAVNFGIIYGIGAFSLAKDLGVPRRQADAYIQSYLDNYPRIRAYRDGVVRQAKEDGYVQTLFGRRRYLPELRASNAAQRAFGERVAMNMPMQGTAADIIKIAMIRVSERLEREGMCARLILQVHDELIVEAPQEEADRAAALLREEMEAVADLDVPLVADVHIGPDWFSAKN